MYIYFLAQNNFVFVFINQSFNIKIAVISDYTSRNLTESNQDLVQTIRQ